VLGEHRLQGVDDPGFFLTLGPFALQDRRPALSGLLQDGRGCGGPHALAEVGLDLDHAYIEARRASWAISIIALVGSATS
jgi:hypothetical protein